MRHYGKSLNLFSETKVHEGWQAAILLAVFLINMMFLSGCATDDVVPMDQMNPPKSDAYDYSAPDKGVEPVPVPTPEVPKPEKKKPKKKKAKSAVAPKA